MGSVGCGVAAAAVNMVVTMVVLVWRGRRRLGDVDDGEVVGVVGVVFGGVDDKDGGVVWWIYLQARNKFGFIDGTCLRESYATSDVLNAQWDRCNVMVLTWIINDVSQETTRSALLTRDPLHDVKNAYNTISKEESHREFPESSGVSEAKTNATYFAAKSFNNTRRSFNNNYNMRGSTVKNNNNRGLNPNLNCTKYGKIRHTIKRCYELVGFPPRFKKIFNAANKLSMLMLMLKMIRCGPSFFNGNVYVNINFSMFYCANSKLYVKTISLGWIIDSGTNQHLTVSIVGMFNVIDISCLKITVGHPNRNLATISHVRNMKLTNNVVLSQSPNDEWMTLSVEDGSSPFLMHRSTYTTNLYQEEDNDVQTHGVRRSSRQIKMPVKLNDFVVGSNVRYGIEKYTGLSVLRQENQLLVFMYFWVSPWCLGKVKKQTTLSKSYAEAKYRSMTSTTCELPIPYFMREPNTLNDVHLVREKFSADIIKTVKIHTDIQTADIVTKCLGTMQHNLFCRNLGMHDMFAVKAVDKVQVKNDSASAKDIQDVS
nr:hypothetical protein [Tanacetum cinerariifolium]